MASSTSPDNIVYPDASDPIAPLNAVFQDLAESVQEALDTIVPGAESLPDLSDVTITTPADGQLLAYNGTNWVNEGLPQMSFTASVTITASDATWTVPSLGSPVVKVTVVAGGGGGGTSEFFYGGLGGTTSFTFGATTLTALGGLGAQGGTRTANGQNSRSLLVAGNGGGGGTVASSKFGQPGLGGEVRIAYYNLADVSTANVTIGGGGSGGATGSPGGIGGSGVVIVEYVAGV